jgi:hypothetical protein
LENTSVSLKTIKDKVKVILHGKMEKITMEIGLMARNTETEYGHLQMEIFTLEIGWMERLRVMEYIPR